MLPVSAVTAHNINRRGVHSAHAAAHGAAAPPHAAAAGEQRGAAVAISVGCLPVTVWWHAQGLSTR